MSTREIHYDDIKVGDKIEITTPVGGVFQDFVVGFSLGGVLFRNGFCLMPRNGYSYRLLFREKPAPKVGDVIPGSEVFNLPLGSHVSNIEYDMVVSSPHLTWIVARRALDNAVIVVRADSDRIRQMSLSGQYRITYLPPWSNNAD